MLQKKTTVFQRGKSSEHSRSIVEDYMEEQS